MKVLVVIIGMAIVTSTLVACLIFGPGQISVLVREMAKEYSLCCPGCLDFPRCLVGRERSTTVGTGRWYNGIFTGIAKYTYYFGDGRCDCCGDSLAILHLLILSDSRLT